MDDESLDLDGRFYGAAEALERRCREHAAADGIDLADREAVDAWCWDRYREGDGDLRGLLGAQIGIKAAQYDVSLRSLPVEWQVGHASHQLTDSDLVDEDPLFDLLEAHARRCTALAQGDGVAMDDADAVARWLRRRYDAGDVEVRSGLACYALLDAASASTSLESEPLKSVIGYFVIEMRCTTDDGEGARDYVPDEIWDFDHGRCGTFTSGAATYEVRVFLDDPYGKPHFHLRRLRAPRIPDVCIAIHEPEYVPHGPDRRGLRPGEVEDLIAFLEGRHHGWPRLSEWAAVAYCWDDYHERERDDMSYYGALRMPDYRTLHWPEGTD